MTTTIVLHGASNDADALRTAVRFAACDGTSLRIVLGEGCSEESLEAVLYVCLHEVRTKLGLRVPEFIIDRRGNPEAVAGNRPPVGALKGGS